MEAMWLVLPDSKLSKEGKLRERTEFEIDEEFRAADRGKMDNMEQENDRSNRRRKNGRLHLPNQALEKLQQPLANN